MGLLLSIFDRGDSSPELRQWRVAHDGCEASLTGERALAGARASKSLARMRAIRCLNSQAEKIRTADALLGDPDLGALRGDGTGRLGYEPSLAV